MPSIGIFPAICKDIELVLDLMGICLRMKKVNNTEKPFSLEDDKKTNWDLFITLNLIFTCLVTPFRVAFFTNDIANAEYNFMIGDSEQWTIIQYAVDGAFFPSKT